MMHMSRENFDGARRGSSKLPGRPDTSILNAAIPLFYIGRNKNGFWLAREVGGRIGGIFLFRESAMRFAGKYSLPGGCATMCVPERFELDVENYGNPLVAWLDAALRSAARLIPNHPSPIPIGRRIFKGDRP